MKSEWAYDIIAPFYDDDMGLNMPFNDASGYLRLLPPAPAEVLEVGCGTGRLTLAIAGCGYYVTAIDRSEPMLAQLRGKFSREHNINPLHMDARRITLSGPFDVVCFTYSGFQYLLNDRDIGMFCQHARRILAPGGSLILDIFLHQPDSETDGFSLDYERELADGRVISRYKSVSICQGVNHVCRRYFIVGKSESLHYNTQSFQRLYTPQSLANTLAKHGFMLDAGMFDYESSTCNATCCHRFYTARFLPT